MSENSEKRMLEVFSGTGRMAAAFKERGWNTLTVDLHQDADLEIDVRQLTYDIVVERLGGEPDVIWLSPPCTGFSMASVGAHWGGDRPDKVAQDGIGLFAEAFRIIMLFRKATFYIENPHGMTYTLPLLNLIPRHRLTYCQYGENRQKPTLIWTNDDEWQPAPACKKGSPCHEAAPRGSKTGTQGIKGAKDRGAIPFQLCEEIARRHTPEEVIIT